MYWSRRGGGASRGCMHVLVFPRRGLRGRRNTLASVFYHWSHFFFMASLFLSTSLLKCLLLRSPPDNTQRRSIIAQRRRAEKRTTETCKLGIHLSYTHIYIYTLRLRHVFVHRYHTPLPNPEKLTPSPSPIGPGDTLAHDPADHAILSFDGPWCRSFGPRRYLGNELLDRSHAQLGRGGPRPPHVVHAHVSASCW